MRVRYFHKICIFLLIFSINIFCSPWSISLSSGIIRNTQPDVEDLNKHAIFPEIQIERLLVDVNKDVNWISGAIYFSYWDDFVSEQTKFIMDHSTYNHHFSIIGTRICLNTKPGNFHFSIFGGISRNYIYSDYIGGGYFSGDGGDIKEKKTLYNCGINIDYSIYENISIGLGGISEFSMQNDFTVNPRLGFKIFLRYEI